MTVYSADYCLGPILTMPLPNKISVFDRLLAPTSKGSKSKRKRKAKKPHHATVSINMTGRGRDPTRSQRGRQRVCAPLVSSPDPECSPGLSQVLIEPEGVFRGTRSRVVVPYNYKQPSSSIRAISPEPLRIFFQ